MFGAFTALGFRIQRTSDPHDDGMAQKFSALVTKIRSIQHLWGHFEVIKSERFPEAMVMMRAAVHGKETDQFVRVLLELLGSIRTFAFLICHGCSLLKRKLIFHNGD